MRISLAGIEGEIYDTGLVHEAAVTAADHDIFGSIMSAPVVPPAGTGDEKP